MCPYIKYKYILTIGPTLIQKIFGENHTLERLALQIEPNVEQIPCAIRLDREQLIDDGRWPTCPAAVEHQMD